MSRDTAGGCNPSQAPAASGQGGSAQGDNGEVPTLEGADTDIDDSASTQESVDAESAGISREAELRQPSARDTVSADIESQEPASVGATMAGPREEAEQVLSSSDSRLLLRALASRNVGERQQALFPDIDSMTSGMSNQGRELLARVIRENDEVVRFSTDLEASFEQDRADMADLRARANALLASQEALLERVINDSEFVRSVTMSLIDLSGADPSVRDAVERMYSRRARNEPPAPVCVVEVAFSNFETDDTETTMCCICLEEPPKDLSKIDACVHSFCFTCIKTWSERQNKCPLCKQSFETITRRSTS